MKGNKSTKALKSIRITQLLLDTQELRSNIVQAPEEVLKSVLMNNGSKGISIQNLKELEIGVRAEREKNHIEKFLKRKLSLRSDFNSPAKHSPSISARMSLEKKSDTPEKIAFTLNSNIHSFLKTLNSEKEIVDGKINQIEKIQDQNMKKTEEKVISNRKIRRSRHVADSLDDDEVLESELNYFLIDKGSFFGEFWNILILTISLFYVFIYPIFFAFPPYQCLAFKILVNLIDFIYFVDFLFGFITPVTNFNDELITNTFDIAHYYLKNGMFTELIFAIPFNIFLYQSNNLLNLLFLLKCFKTSRLRGLVNSLIDRFEGKTGVNHFIKFLIKFIAVSHIITCIWLFLATFNQSENWIIGSNLTNLNFFGLYIASLYFNWTTIFTIGYGDILAYNYYERVFNILLMIFGICIYSYAVSSLGNILATYDQATRKFLKNMDLLQEIKIKYPTISKTNYKIDNKEKHELNREDNNRTHLTLYIRVKRYLQYEYKTNRNAKVDFLEDLPRTTKNQLLLCLHKEYVKNFLFFKFASLNQTNEDFMSQIILLMKPLQLFKNEIVIRESTHVNDLIMIKNGLILGEINFQNHSFPIFMFKKNDFFGFFELLEASKSKLTFRVKSKSAELLLISKSDIYKLTYSFPVIFKSIYKSALNSHKSLMEMINSKQEKLSKESEFIEQKFASVTKNEYVKQITLKKRTDNVKIKKSTSLIENIDSESHCESEIKQFKDLFSNRKNELSSRNSYLTQKTNCNLNLESPKKKTNKLFQKHNEGLEKINNNIFRLKESIPNLPFIYDESNSSVRPDQSTNYGVQSRDRSKKNEIRRKVESIACKNPFFDKDFEIKSVKSKESSRSKDGKSKFTQKDFLLIKSRTLSPKKKKKNETGSKNREDSLSNENFISRLNKILKVIEEKT